MGIELINVSNGGHGASGYRHRDDTLAHFSKNRKGEANAFFGKQHSDAVKQKISKNKKANPSKPWLGKTRSEETRKKIAESLKGRIGHKHTDESKQKLSLAHTGKKQAPPSEETRKKLSESVKKSWILRRQYVRKEV
jgi:hypothetical protein